MKAKIIIFILSLSFSSLSSAAYVYSMRANGTGLNLIETNSGVVTLDNNFTQVGSLAYGEGIIYSKASTNNVFAYDLTAGAVQSYTGLNLANGSSIAYGQGSLFGVGANGSGLRQLDIATGTVNTYSSFSHVGALTYGDGVIFSKTASNDVFSYNLLTGVVESYTDLNLANGSGITYGQGSLFGVGANGSGLRQLDLATGSITTYSSFTYAGPLAYGEGVIYAKSASNDIYSYNLSTNIIESYTGLNLANGSGIAFGASEVPLPASLVLFFSSVLTLVISKSKFREQ